MSCISTPSIHQSRKPSCLEPLATVSRGTRRTSSYCATGRPMYLECSTPHSRALADPVVRGMSLDDLIARSAICSSVRLVELESCIRSQIYPNFLRVNPRLNSLLLKFLNEFFLSLSRAPWGTGNGVVLTADSLYHFKLLMISVKRRAYLRNNFGRNCSRAGKTTTVRVVACTVYCKGFAVCRLTSYIPGYQFEKGARRRKMVN